MDNTYVEIKPITLEELKEQLGFEKDIIDVEVKDGKVFLYLKSYRKE